MEKTIDQKVYKFYNEKNEHLHTLEGKPLVGTSGVVKVVSIPLTWWASGHAVKILGITDPKLITKIKRKTATKAEIEELKNSVGSKLEEIKLMDVDQFYDLLDLAYRAHSTSLAESADAGTDLHAELERFVKDRIEGFDIDKPVKAYHPRIKPFIEWYTANVKQPLWSESHCFSREYWLGGICDFGFIDNKDQVGIMDFKSAKDAYPAHFWQCAGYDIQFSENGGFTSDGVKVFDLPKPVSYYAVFPFGMDHPVPKFDYDVEGCRDAFLACLLLYKKLNANN